MHRNVLVCEHVSFSPSPKHSETYPLFFVQSHKRHNKNDTTDHTIDCWPSGGVGSGVPGGGGSNRL